MCVCFNENNYSCTVVYIISYRYIFLQMMFEKFRVTLIFLFGSEQLKTLRVFTVYYMVLIFI